MSAPLRALDGELELIEAVGRGAQGTVWRALQPAVGRTVAVKRLGSDAGEEAAARLEQEARLASRIDHAAVVQVWLYGTLKGAPALVMDFVDGQDLQSLLRSMESDPDLRRLEAALGSEPGTFSQERSWWRAAATRTRDLAFGLEAAHQAGVLHRDVKPANVLISREGRAQLTDFGLAILDESGETADVGSLAYRAPECHAGEPTTRLSDVYSMGVLLRSFVDARPPLVGLSRAAVVDAASKGLPPLPLGKRRLPRGLRAIIARATSVTPETRYSSAGELGRDLDALLAGRPLLARPDTAVDRVRRVLRRHGGRITAAVFALLFLAATLAWLQGQRLQAAERVGEAARAAEGHLGLALEGIERAAMGTVYRDLDGVALMGRRRADLLETALVSMDDLLATGMEEGGNLQRAKALRVELLTALSILKAEMGEGAASADLAERAVGESPYGISPDNARGLRYAAVLRARLAGDLNALEEAAAVAIQFENELAVSDPRRCTYGPDLHVALAHARTYRGDAKGAMAAANAGVASLSRVVAAAPRDLPPKIASAYARTLAERAGLRVAQGDLGGARLDLESVEAILPDAPASFHGQKARALHRLHLGRIARQQGPMADAESNLRAAVLGLGQLAQGRPDNVHLAVESAMAEYRLMDTLLSLGRNTQELHDLIFSCTPAAEQLRVSEPQLVEVHELRATIHRRQGFAARGTKNIAGSVIFFDAALVSCREVLARAPEAPGARQLLENTWLQRMSAFLGTRSTEDGMQALRESLTVDGEPGGRAASVTSMMVLVSNTEERNGDPNGRVAEWRREAVDTLREAFRRGDLQAFQARAHPTLSQLAPLPEYQTLLAEIEGR